MPPYHRVEMLKRFRNWLAGRKQRKAAKYSEQYGFMDADQLERLREQQSPLRGMGRGTGGTGRRP
jgi:hypothetical protein